MELAQRADSFGFNYFGRMSRDSREMRRQIIMDGPSLEIGDINQGFRALYGIEIRDPLGDRRLVEWSLGVPEEQYYRNGEARWLIKRLMKGRLPNKVLYNRRKGRQMADWHVRMTRDLPRMKEDLERMSLDRDTSRMIDIPRLHQLLEDWPKETVISRWDDRSYFLPINVPLTLAAGRFVRWVKRAND
jgi:asparagine synthase (glutamine-hydrolysing)